MKKRLVDLSLEETAKLFSEAGRRAVERARKKGLPLTGTKDGKIVRTHPDGREEVLKDLRQGSEKKQDDL